MKSSKVFTINDAIFIAIFAPFGHVGSHSFVRALSVCETHLKVFQVGQVGSIARLSRIGPIFPIHLVRSTDMPTRTIVHAAQRGTTPTTRVTDTL